MQHPLVATQKEAVAFATASFIISIMVPKAGLEPARISTVDFESTASTDFATSALKRYAENVVDYTCRTPPCKRQLARTSLSAEIFSIACSDV